MTDKAAPGLKIVVDTREQAPFSFAGYPAGLVQQGLATGDYSLAGLVDRVAVERKSLDDLVGSLTSGRERFAAELQRGRAFDAFAVVCEGSWSDLAAGRYRSKALPASLTASVVALSMRTRTQFFFAGSRQEAESVTYNFLRLYLQSATKRLAALVNSHDLAILDEVHI